MFLQWQDFHFLLLDSIPLCLYTTFSLSIKYGWFHTWGTVNNAAINMEEKVCFWHTDFLPFGYISGIGIGSQHFLKKSSYYTKIIPYGCTIYKVILNFLCPLIKSDYRSMLLTSRDPTISYRGPLLCFYIPLTLMGHQPCCNIMSNERTVTICWHILPNQTRDKSTIPQSKICKEEKHERSLTTPANLQGLDCSMRLQAPHRKEAVHLVQVAGCHTDIQVRSTQDPNSLTKKVETRVHMWFFTFFFFLK
jgi:hypothetical protein